MRRCASASGTSPHPAGLSDQEIKPVLKLKHQEIARFSLMYGVNIGWLLEGKGPIVKGTGPQ